jgi:hypothetical protein
MKVMRKYWPILILVPVLFAVVILRFFPKGKISKATDTSTSLTTQPDWQAGAYDPGIDLTSTPGSIKLVPGSSTIDLTKLGSSNVTTNYDAADKMYPIGGNYSGATDSSNSWSWGDTTGGTYTWQVDLGASYSISSVKGRSLGIPLRLSYSSDGINWTSIPGLSGSDTLDQYTFSPAVTARYFKQEDTLPPNSGAIGLFREIQLSPAGDSATHTTAPTQIDGGENFWQWESFTPTQSVPANTSVTYRFRTSTNGSDWTGWVGSIGAVTSRTGDNSNNPTKYRYLQIEATLSNTDGASTPTIDQYDIGYHTEHKPNKPTAQTAVVN